MTRIEHDFIGDLEVPANAYYGVQSLRGKENFFITEEKNNQEIYFIIAFAYVKKAAAMANKELGVVKPEVADAMIWLATSSSTTLKNIVTSSSLTGCRAVPVLLPT